jgi:hypothetical protein
MYKASENYGWWTADVFVSGILRDSKNQAYPPHGSLPAPAIVRSGQQVVIGVAHAYFTVILTWFGPLGRFVPLLTPQFAFGIAACIMP